MPTTSDKYSMKLSCWAIDIVFIGAFLKPSAILPIYYDVNRQ